MYRRRIIILATMLCYFGVTSYGLVLFDAGLLASNLILFGIPALLLGRFSVAPPMVILSVTFLGLGLGVLLEGIAHIYGLWYTLGVNELSLLGVLPLESIFATTVEVLFLALLYENIFDDGQYTKKSARSRGKSFVIFAILVFALMIFSYYLRNMFFIQGTYIWVVLGVLVFSFIALSSYRAFSVLFLDRIVYFSMVAALPLSASLILSVVNVHKVFGNPSEYVWAYVVNGNILPLEAILMVFALPVLVATVYEIYLDDQA